MSDGHPSRRSRSYSPVAKRKAKRLRLDPSPSSSLESMNSERTTSREASGSRLPAVSNVLSTTVGYQQSPTTSAPAWSIDLGPTGFHHLIPGASSSSGLAEQPRFNPILTTLPSPSNDISSTVSGQRSITTCLPLSHFPSSTSIAPDTSAATHHSFTTPLQFPTQPVRVPSLTTSIHNQSQYIEQPIPPLSSQSNPAVRHHTTYSSQQDSSASTPIPSPNAPNPGEGTTSPARSVFASDFARDALLSHAYRLCNLIISPGLSPMPNRNSENETLPFANHAYTMELLPILRFLKEHHPIHIPVILLLGCVLHSAGDYNGCIEVNLEILQLDPNYVEAMSNIGTALFSLGRPQEAEAWWWKAIRTRPLFWDATDNILSVLCNPVAHPGTEPPRYQDAARVCEFIESHVLNDNGELLVDVPLSQKHRIQSLLYTHGNLVLAHGSSSAPNAAVSLFLQGLDLVMRSSDITGKASSYTSIDVIIAVCVAGLLSGGSPDNHLASEVARALGISSLSRSYGELLAPQFNVLQAVCNAGPRLIEVLLRMGGGSLPMTLLLPEQASCLPSLLFPSHLGNLPGLVKNSGSSNHLDASPAHGMTSTILLSLARIFQSDSNISQPSLTAKGIAVQGGTSLVLLLYYLAVAIHPSPAICNNMGIILSTIPLSIVREDNGSESVSGQHIAKAYYTKGLAQDGAHPHLLTNLGSLLKDQGKIEEAIRTYAQVLQLKPDFDVALANMGNVIKDLGRPHEAITFYQRALEANPNFQEAICGLAGAQAAICDWRGRGGTSGDLQLDDQGQLSNSPQEGWINKVVKICDQQLLAGYSYGIGVMQSHSTLKQWLGTLETAYGRPFCRSQKKRWTKLLQRFFTSFDRLEKRVNEGGMIIRLVEFIICVTQRRWYIEVYGQREYTRNGPEAIPICRRMYEFELQKYKRPKISAMGPPPVPSILPFHTFTYPLSSRSIRLVSHRNALRISYTTQTQSWLPLHVYPPPAPLRDKLKIGYVSSDLNNHPLAHLMQSVFGFHDRDKFEIHVYATSSSDGSEYRRKIETESQHFLDVSHWSTKSIIERIVADGIHILINLGGYTKGARNDIFAARPAPVQLQLMGFAGTLAAGWCDYLVTDVISTPPDTCAWERWRKQKEQEEAYRKRSGGRSVSPETNADSNLDPESSSDEWMYTEHMIYMPHTFFVTDHKQSSNPKSISAANLTSEGIWKEEENARAQLRKEIFPDLSSETFIFANFNQVRRSCQTFAIAGHTSPSLVIQDPTIFAVWIKILQLVPNSVLWLLRFPSAGEEHLKRTATIWADSEIASRLLFTDVVPKEEHLRRIRIADLVLDTVECNAHTIATDVLWAGTPIITWPKYQAKMCSRVATSIAMATSMGEKMVVHSIQEYEDRAIYYARSVHWLQEGAEGRRPAGELIDLRKELFLGREQAPLFDTLQWTRHLEKGIAEAWRRWVAGTCFGECGYSIEEVEIIDATKEISDEWEKSDGPEKSSGSIWVKDLDDDVSC